MNPKRCLYVLALGLLWTFVGCSNSDESPTEPGNYSEFYIDNGSGVDLTVYAETPTTYPLTAVVSSGETVRLTYTAAGTYTDFASPSAALVRFELRSTDSGETLYSQIPVNNAAWEATRGGRVMSYVLVISDEDLGAGR